MCAYCRKDSNDRKSQLKLAYQSGRVSPQTISSLEQSGLEAQQNQGLRDIIQMLSLLHSAILTRLHPKAMPWQFQGDCHRQSALCAPLFTPSCFPASKGTKSFPFLGKQPKVTVQFKNNEHFKRC